MFVDCELTFFVGKFILCIFEKDKELNLWI